MGGLRNHCLHIDSERYQQAEVNREALLAELDKNWEVLAEPVQTVMRRYGIETIREAKELTRGKRVDGEAMRNFIDGLELPEEEKRLKEMTPKLYRSSD